jgi:hypothetical protein
VPRAQLFGTDVDKELEEREWKEGTIKLPGFPKPADLLEFDVGPATSFRFYIDRKSLTVGQDGVIRYTLVARSPLGAENVSYEGMRCRPGVHRVYAYGQRDGSWRERPSEWKELDIHKSQRVHMALRRDFFCPHDKSIHDAAEGLDALRRGLHPKL